MTLRALLRSAPILRHARSSTKPLNPARPRRLARPVQRPQSGSVRRTPRIAARLDSPLRLPARFGRATGAERLLGDRYASEPHGGCVRSGWIRRLDEELTLVARRIQPAGARDPG